MKRIIKIFSIVLLLVLLVACSKKDDIYYTVFFDTNGGEPIVESVLVKENDLIEIVPNEPEKVGYEFLYWFSSDLDKPWDFLEDKVIKDTFLVATYKEIQDETVEYTVTFDSDGGSLIDPIIIDEGSKVTKPTDPIKEGYEFLGWYLNDKLFDFNTKINSNTKLSAKWKVIKVEDTTHTITFKVDDKTTNELVVEGNKVTKPTDPVKEDFNFIGWYLGDVLFNFNNEVTKDLVLEAKFEEKIVYFDVTFDFGIANKDNVIIEVQRFFLVDAIDAPNVDGYYFVEWQLNGSHYDFNIGITSDITLVAKYEEIPISDYMAVEYDISDIELLLEDNKIEEGFNVPLVGKYGSTLTWEFDNPNHLIDGVVTYINGLDNITNLKVTATKGNESMPKEFTVEIISLNEIKLKNDLNIINNIFINEYINSSYLLPTVGNNGSTISWKIDSDLNLVDGKLVYIESEDIENIVVLEVTLELNGLTKTNEFTVKIMPLDLYNLNLDKETIDLLHETVINENFRLPTILDNGSTVEWLVGPEELFVDGVLIIPEQEEISSIDYTIKNGEFELYGYLEITLSKRYTLSLPQYVTSNIKDLDDIPYGTTVYLEVNVPSNMHIESFIVNNVKVDDTSYVFDLKQSTVVTLTLRDINNEITFTEDFTTLAQWKQDGGVNFSSYEDFVYTGANGFNFDIIKGRIDLGMRQGDQGITLAGRGNLVTGAGMGWILLEDFAYGLTKIEFEARLPFSPESTYPQREGKDTAQNVKISVFVNDELKEILQFENNTTANKGETFVVANLNYVGITSFRIEVSSGHRLTIGSIKWTTNNGGVINELEEITNVDFEGTKFNFDTTESVHSFNGYNYMLKEVHTDSMHPDKEQAYITVDQGLVVSRFRGASNNQFSTPTAYIYNVDPFDYVKSITFDAKQFGSDSYFNPNAIIKVYYKTSSDDDFILINTITDLKETKYQNYFVDINKDDVQIKIEVSNGTLNIDNIVYLK